MARGFWTGLGHGAVLSAVVLVSLALILPLPGPQAVPQQDEESAATGPGKANPVVTDAAPGPGSDTTSRPAPEVSAPTTAASDSPPATPETAPEAAATASPSDDDAPQAEAVGLPVGSEFGRGGDVVPLQPAPLAAPASRMDQADAPAVSAPAAEPAPVAITDSDSRPEAPEGAAGRAQAQPAPGDAAPDVAQPGALDMPVMPDAPQMAGFGDRDERPQTAAIRADDPTPPADPAGEPAVSAEGREPSRPERPEPAQDETTTAPAMPSPSLDLSLPPDLSDLRALQRD